MTSPSGETAPTGAVDDRATLVVIPALNEEATIGSVVSAIRRVAPAYDVLVVDDGSRDRTAERARTAGALVSVLPYNLGVGGALRVGYRYAWRWGYECVIQMDADGQHDPAEIRRLLARLHGTPHVDLVVGARFAGRGDYRTSLLRRAVMRFLAAWLSRLAATRLTDVTSGFRACGPNAIGLFARTYPVEYVGATVEALVIAVRSGLSVEQVPVEMRARAGGKPSHGLLRSAIYAVRALAVVALSRFQPWPPPSVLKDPRVVLDNHDHLEVNP